LVVGEGSIQKKIYGPSCDVVRIEKKKERYSWILLSFCGTEWKFDIALTEPIILTFEAERVCSTGNNPKSMGDC